MNTVIEAAVRADFLRWNGGSEAEDEAKIGQYLAFVSENGYVFGDPLGPDGFELGEDLSEEEVLDFLRRDCLKRPPVYALIDAVAEAIREYDRSKDHLRHESGADCVRCKLEAAIAGTYAGKAVRKSH